MSYKSRLSALRNEAISGSYDPRWIAAKIFSETCLDGARRSRFEAFSTQREALCAASEHIGDYDLSRTEFYRPEDIDVEIGDPAMERVENELEASGRVTLGDYDIVLEELTDDEIAAALATANDDEA